MVHYLVSTLSLANVRAPSMVHLWTSFFSLLTKPKGMKKKSQYQEIIISIMETRGVDNLEAQRIYRRLYEQDKELDPKVLDHAHPQAS